VPAPVSIDDRTFDGPHGPVPARVYKAGDGPTFVWSHGGGWVGGDLDMVEADGVARAVAEGLGGVVVSVEYRLAPAHVFPVPVDDVVAAFEGTLASTDLVADPARVALGGASAGAHLSALAMPRLSRPPAALVLVYPATDPMDGPYVRRPDGILPEQWLGRTTAVSLFSTLLGSSFDLANGDDAPADAVPAKATFDRRAWPPTLVTTAEIDGLAPQAFRYVELLREAGVDVTHDHVPELFHGYLSAVGISRRSDAALARHIDWLRTALASGRA
jgi:acetyl esterase